MDQINVIENTSSDSNEKSDKNSPILVMNEDDKCPSTPIEDVFDSFTPAINRCKHVEKPETHVARKLKFNSGFKKCVSEAEYETVYESVLEAIIYKEAEDLIAEIVGRTDVFTTPPGARLSGIAETCPGAPLKRVKKSRKVDIRFCRKLDF